MGLDRHLPTLTALSINANQGPLEISGTEEPRGKDCASNPYLHAKALIGSNFFKKSMASCRGF